MYDMVAGTETIVTAASTPAARSAIMSSVMYMASSIPGRIVLAACVSSRM